MAKKEIGRETQVRCLDDLKDVLYDLKRLKNTPNHPVYYFWRGIKERGDLRYDITVIPAKMMGKEFPKTRGHAHGPKELLNILEGEAFYLFQKTKGSKIDEIKVVKAKKGDWIVVPSEYDHLTINPSKKEELVMANWLLKDCKNDYSIFEKYHGAGYYYTRDGWIKNKNYKKIPEIKFEKPLKKIPENLDFLKK